MGESTIRYLVGRANSSDYSMDFHEITSGSTGTCGLDCDAQEDYNRVTVWGSYQAQNLWLLNDVSYVHSRIL